LLNDWIEENITELRKICNSVARQNNTDDLLQVSIQQFLTNRKITLVPDGEKLFFFARIVRNNFNSKTSKYHKIYRKTNFVELGSNIDIPQEEYTDPILTIEWVLNEIEEMKKYDWYLAQITLHYFAEDCNLTRLSKKIGIPINNLSRDIKKVKLILNDKLQQKLKE
jgi:hypothetical protein